MIEAYFDFRLYRLWKTRQHSKLLDYEDFLWQRHLDQWCRGALQCHEEPVKTDPAFEHCSAVVLGPSTWHKQSYPLSPLRGWEKREGNSRPRGWRWIKLCCASALPRFQKERSPTNREKRPNQHKRGGGEARESWICLHHGKQICLPLEFESKIHMSNVYKRNTIRVTLLCCKDFIFEADDARQKTSWNSFCHTVVLCFDWTSQIISDPRVKY